ncbi:MAG: glycoside hydrolase family 3 C-terminal domain-containing protein [Candidatus Bipolaricaulota bacterium]|nr:glycoside hydrolase family 3 C-terminal domain-containing protein [Candidatus Bipolaricaulota bacterium]MDW8151700.1 glycoside hydrolase family 3 N-terminal domain-containing protein [Candidatus Bipolaricaulota bacterium]
MCLANVFVLCFCLVAFALAAEPPVVQTRYKPLLCVDGYLFRDLNANGQLDVYEDWRRSVDERVEDLLARMTLAEKVAQMMHPTFIPRPDGSPPPFMEKWCRDLQIGFVLVRDLPSARAAAECMNRLQEWCEQSRLGIPIVVSMDSIHGLSYVNGGIVYPHNLGLAAIGDLNLVRALVEAARKEHLAVGVRMTLSPNADLATEPRWGRVYECPGEDANFAAEFVRVYVEAYQNGTALNRDSIICCVKHFPGAGPQMEGVDMAPIVSTPETLPLHLLPFKAAIEVGVASVMPYYSIPLALDTMAALGSRKTLQDLLRQNLGFTGFINTDWGMQFGIRQAGMFWGREISNDEALIIGIEQAEVDVVGGASPRDISDVVRLVEIGKIRVERINESVRRILRVKFMLGIFENPYVDPSHAEKIVGCPAHQALSLEAARRSLTLIKNTGILPLRNVNSILVAGLRAGDVDSLTGGWTSKQTGLTIVEAIRALAGEGVRVHYVAENVEEARVRAAGSDVAIVVVGEPAYVHNPPWGASTLELTSSQQKLLEAVHETGTPLVVVVLLARPYILTWCAEKADAIIIAYLPGTQGAQAIAEVLFGRVNPQGRLPIQLPRNMEQVRNQRSDLPADLTDPLYERGFGLSYSG